MKIMGNKIPLDKSYFDFEEIKKVLIIIPSYNEEKTIGKVIDNIRKQGFKNVVVVNDGSTDGTRDIIKSLDVLVVNHITNIGKGAALKTGFEYALQEKFDFVVTCDADAQHLAEDVKKISQRLLKEKVEVVLGSRFGNEEEGKNVPLSRNVYNKIANIISFVLTGLNVSDSQCGLRGYSQKALSQIKINSRDMDVELDILKEIKRNSLSFAEVNVTPVYTEYSLSKGQSFGKGIETLYKLLMQKF